MRYFLFSLHADAFIAVKHFYFIFAGILPVLVKIFFGDSNRSGRIARIVCKLLCSGQRRRIGGI